MMLTRQITGIHVVIVCLLPGAIYAATGKSDTQNALNITPTTSSRKELRQVIFTLLLQLIVSLLLLVVMLLFLFMMFSVVL